MTDEDTRQAPTGPIPPWALWFAVVALSGGSGMGSFIGARSADDQPSERLARIELHISAVQTSIADVRRDVRELQKQRSDCDGKTANLKWRIERCEQSLGDEHKH